MLKKIDFDQFSVVFLCLVVFHLHRPQACPCFDLLPVAFFASCQAKTRPETNPPSESVVCQRVIQNRYYRVDLILSET